MNSDKCDELLDRIDRGTYRYLVAFKEALYKTHHSHLEKNASINCFERAGVQGCEIEDFPSFTIHVSVY